MALIIHMAMQSPGRCWLNYDRVFRLHAAASNWTNWNQIHLGLYDYHTAVSVQSAPTPVSRFWEPLHDQTSPIAGKFWNAGTCSSSHEFWRFHHNCDRGRCGGAHRRINCLETEGVVLSKIQSAGARQDVIRDAVIISNISSSGCRLNNVFTFPCVSSVTPVNVDNFSVQ